MLFLYYIYNESKKHINAPSGTRRGIMKSSRLKIIGAVIVVPIFAVVCCISSLHGEGVSVRSGTVQMKSGETGSTGGGSPPGPFGDHWVHIQNNANVDSYDSRIGPYSESHDSDANVGCNVDPNDAAAGVSMNNNGTVSGDISVTTSEASGDIVLDANSNFSGTPNYDSAPWELLPITMPAWYTEPAGVPNGQIDGTYGSRPGSYEITNNSLRAYNNASITFYGGEYHFEDFELSNNVNFLIDPAIGEDETVDIYVGNSIIFENNSELLPAIEFSGDTTKLRFFFSGTTTVDLSNNVVFYGFIYAPNAMIEVMNNMDIYGNIVGKEVWIWNNGGVHYDKALLGQDFGNVFTGGIPAAPHKKTDWKETIVSD